MAEHTQITTPRELPRVDRMLEDPAIGNLIEDHGRAPVTTAIRRALEWARQQLREGPIASSDLHQQVALEVEILLGSGLRPVINGTGVLLHTNLGRAPISNHALRRATTLGQGFCNLEFDLEDGNRGVRGGAVQPLLETLTGAEAALCVNNNAAAVLLSLAAIGGKGEVIVSRGELVEIGGSYRMPDVMRLSGVRLCEIGTTNRTRVEDFATAIGPDTQAVLRVHRGNFHIEGFVQSPDLADVCTAAHKEDIPVLVDLGHGCVQNLSLPEGDGLPSTVQGCLKAGADVVLFSGDKLLGGPQCGIAVGRADLIESMRKHAYYRTVRVGKLTIAALEAVLRDHIAGRIENIPALAALSLASEVLQIRAQALVETYAQQYPDSGVKLAPTPCESEVGGGSDARYQIDSYGITVQHDTHSAHVISTILRRATPSVVGRVENDKVVLDLRTIQEAELEDLRQVLAQIDNGP